MLHDIVISTAITNGIIVGRLQRRAIIALVEFGSDEERICIIEERGPLSRRIDTEQKMIAFYESVEVNTCPKPVLGQRGGAIFPQR